MLHLLQVGSSVLLILVIQGPSLAETPKQPPSQTLPVNRARWKRKLGDPAINNLLLYPKSDIRFHSTHWPELVAKH